MMRSRYRSASRHTGGLGGRSARYWLVVALLALVALTGGSSRGDAWTLILLRPLAVLALCSGLLTLTGAHVREYRFLFGMSFAAIVLGIAHLFPLPPGLWQSLPGRSILVEVDGFAGLDAVWRPLSMAPGATRNAIFSMIVPMALLVLGVQLSQQEQRRLIVPFLALGGVSALIGALQIIGVLNGPIALYGMPVDGSAAGLLTNRNHQALLLSCLLLMLGHYAADRAPRARVMWHDRRLVMSVGFAILLLPLILLTGSRGGLVFGLFCLIGGGLIYCIRADASPHSRGPTHRRRLMVAGIALVGLISLIGITIASGRALSVSRFLALDVSDAVRGKVWTVVWHRTPDFLPWGSGLGTYEKVYRILEPTEQLRPTYSNHAHNDWLEVLLTSGVAGGLLLLTAIAGFVILIGRIVVARRQERDVSWAVLGAAIILVLAFGSFVDYPLRVPMMACLLVVACLWSGQGLVRRRSAEKQGAPAV